MYLKSTKTKILFVDEGITTLRTCAKPIVQGQAICSTYNETSFPAFQSGVTCQTCNTDLCNGSGVITGIVAIIVFCFSTILVL